MFELRDGIAQTASALQMNPLDLATIISYETGGTFNPSQPGPTTQWGQHRGLIQFGEPQAQQYGVDWNNPAGSQLGPDGAIVRYFQQNGWQPGMGLLDAYSIVNAGGPGRYGASDANNGGAPGTVADKVNEQMGGHRANAERLFNGILAAGGGTDTMTGGAGGDRMAGLLAPQEPARRPSIWDRLEGVPILGGLADPDRRARLAIALDGMTVSPDPAFVAMQLQGIDQRAQERETAQRLNQTIAYLESIGRGDLAALAAIDPGAALGQSQGPSELEQLQLAQAQLDYDQDLAGGAAGGVDYSQTPIYGVNAEGQTVVLQVGDNGTAVQTVLPPGVTVDRPAQVLDTGTDFVLRDPNTGQVTQIIPKNPGGAAAATATGTALGQAGAAATLNLPSAIASADQSMALIDGIIADPALPSILGNVQGNLPAGLPLLTGGQPGSDVGVKIEQLQGQAFLEAFETLKGGGAISEAEGLAATRAIARLSRTQSPEAFRASLTELRDILARGKANAEALAAAAANGGITTTSLAPTGAEVGATLERTRRYNPATGALE